jgi:hypothetical protein
MCSRANWTLRSWLNGVLLAALLSAFLVADVVPAQSALSARVSQGSFGKYHAILFAVGDQSPDSKLPSLRYPISEMRNLSTVLTTQYLFDRDNVELVVNPTRATIIDKLDSLARALLPTDNLLIVYSGHGRRDQGADEGYWQASDAIEERKSTWLPNSEVRGVLRKLRARQVLIISDACFSGMLTRSGRDVSDRETFEEAVAAARRTSRVAMTAGAFDEEVPASSAFAIEIANFLRGNQARAVTASRLANAIRPRVAALTRTSPQYSSIPGIPSEQGDFVFVRRNQVAETTTPVPPERPGDLRQSGQSSIPPIVIELPDSRASRGPLAEGRAAAIRRDWGAAKTEFERHCRAGNQQACAELGQLHEYGRGVSRDVGVARQLYETACTGGEPDGCARLSWIHARGKGVPIDAARALSLAQAACDRGSPLGCNNLGVLYANGEGVARDARRAFTLYQGACDASVQLACQNMGVEYAVGRAVPKDTSLARSRFERACSAGEPLACTNLGAMRFERGDTAAAAELFELACKEGEPGACTYVAFFKEKGLAGRPRDEPAALREYGDACSQGSGQACGLVSQFFLKAADTSRAIASATRGCLLASGSSCNMRGIIAYYQGDRAAARTHYERGCDNLDAAACGNSAGYQRRGEGGPQDLAAAARNYRLGCDLNHGSACLGLAELHETGQGVERSLEQVEKLLQRGCDLNEAKTCNNLGVMLANGTLTPDLERARRLYERACSLAESVGCANLGNFYANGLGGLPKSASTALGLWKRACDAGYHDACDRRLPP